MIVETPNMKMRTSACRKQKVL